MKNLVKKLVACAVSVTCALTMAACASNVDDETGKPEEGKQPTFAEKQIALAKNTLNAFYSKEELFTSSKNEASAVSYALAEQTDNSGQSETSTFAEVSNALAGYSNNSNSVYVKGTFNSYVADIFSYSQVQTSIINEFGEDSLTDVYALNYSNVDWSACPSAWSNWLSSTRLRSAAFAGTDVDNGNVYCTQSHVSGRVLVMANLEYFYNSDGDMGVTTLNWHDDGVFEYHFCSAGTYEILQAYGSYNLNGDINLTSFNYIYKNGQVASNICSETDKQLVYNYVQSEIVRIDGKIENLQEENGRERSLQGDEEDENQAEHIGVCSVEFNFEVLKKMLIK